jgi:hypothetical protein
MMHRTLIFAAAALIAAPAAAQDAPDKLDLVATTIAGLKDTVVAQAGPNSFGPAKRTAAGRYEITADDGSVTYFEVKEGSECVFDIDFGTNGSPLGTIRFDFNLVSGVTYTPSEAMNGLNQFQIALAGDGLLVQVAQPGGEFGQAGNSSSLATALTAEDLQAAAGALEAACPKP